MRLASNLLDNAVRFPLGLYLPACAVSRSTQCIYYSAEQAMFYKVAPMVVSTVDLRRYLYADG